MHLSHFLFKTNKKHLDLINEFFLILQGKLVENDYCYILRKAQYAFLVFLDSVRTILGEAVIFISKIVKLFLSSLLNF